VNGQLLVEEEHWKAADIVIVARGFPNRDTIGFIRGISAAKKPLIYETDDALPLVQEHHEKPWYKETAPHVLECAALANVVTVSTAPLAEFFRTFNPSVEVIENQLDPRIWTPRLRDENLSRDGGIRIGIVASKHHERDLEILDDVVGTAAGKHAEVTWIGYGDGAGKLLKNLPPPKVQVLPTNYDYQSHPERLARLGLDIGLCPLLDDDFNRCKSDIKYLEFGFLGICGIYSKLPPYVPSVSHRITGMLCDWSEKSWADAIETLVADENLRHELSRKAYASIQPRILSCENNRWNQILESFV
jgi:glycosyltransferase involved in cell wall biosynthesis